nr:uncharacterized protein LOC124812623 [Hydra vulgaris]
MLLQYSNNTCPKWSQLISRTTDTGHTVKLSNLNKVSIFPKPIERQSVSTCLRIFCDKTYHALINHPRLQHIKERQDTADFINIVVSWWKVLNVKGTGADVRFNDELQAVIRDRNDNRLENVLNFRNMALKMAGKQGKRKKQLTCDTAQPIYHTCNGVVELCRSLLNSSHQYVILSEFSTDPLEKEFSKLRQGSGGTYFITVQQVIEKLNISRAKLLLSLNNPAVDICFDTTHSYPNCGFLLDESSAEIFDNLPNLESFISSDTNMALIYISEYLTRKDNELSENELLEKTTFYHQKFGQYIESIDRGGLNIPTDNTCQWKQRVQNIGGKNCQKLVIAMMKSFMTNSLMAKSIMAAGKDKESF